VIAAVLVRKVRSDEQSGRWKKP